MEGINWLNHSSDDFTLFCSALLAMEMGKNYQPFTAHGKDQGIDGWYSGKYGERKGTWRFQFKFHGVARKQGFNLLTADLKKEISKIKDENFFILVTNVELLPQEKIELTQDFSQLITVGKQTQFEIWDGAKLFTLYLQFPILSLWLNEGFDTAQLQDYKIAFKSNLEVGENEPSSLHNFFIARESDIEVLHTFLRTPETMLLITGEAGIGKTRMVLEFFHLVSRLDGWLTLVLLNRSIDFDKLKNALSGKANAVILIDDAHTFAPEAIADIKKLADLSNGRVKLILTSRILEAYTSLKLIKEYEQEKIKKIQLEELSRADTKQLFQHELANLNYLNYVDELTQISHGKPVLIVALLRAIKNGTRIEQVRAEGFLTSYVRNFFDTLISKVSEEAGASKIQVTKLIQLICLIEPFNYSNQSAIAKLAASSGLPEESVILTLELLLQKGFSTGRSEQSIRPDYYSDIILMEADAEMLVLQLQGLAEYINNIITNLSSVDEVKKQEQSFLDKLLGIYVSNITSSEDIDYILKIYTTVASITYQKPKAATEAIDLYFASLNDSGNIIAQDFQNHVSYYHQSQESINGRVKSMLVDLLHLKEYYEYAFTAFLKLVKLTKDDKVASSVINFARRDFIEKFRLERQIFFLQRFIDRTQIMDEDEYKLAIQCCKIFLQLDFTASSWSGSDRNSLILTTYFLPNSTGIRKFRQKIIDLLVKIYDKSSIPSIRASAFHELLDIPRGIFATKRNKTVYKGEPEIQSILDFLSKRVIDLSSSLQKEVIDKIYWYKQWGIAEQFLAQLDEITRLMAPKNLTEQLVHLFSRSELGLPSNAEIKVVAKSKELIPGSNAEELTEAINHLVKDDFNQFPYLWTFLSVLQIDFTGLAKEVYNNLWQRNKSFIYQFGAPFLQELYFRHHDSETFWLCVNQLIAENDPNADNVLLRVYGRSPNTGNLMTTEDISLIKGISDKQHPANNFELAKAILPVITFGEEIGRSLAISFLSRCGQREADIFFIFLTDNNSKYYDTFRTLCLQHTFRFYIGYEIENSLNKIVLREGFMPAFDYFKNRYERKKEQVINEKTLLGYDWVPDGDHSHLFDGCEPNEKFKFFEAIVDWYMAEQLDSLQEYIAKDFLSYGQPSKSIDEKLFRLFKDLFLTYRNDHLKIKRVLECLVPFHDKERNLLELVLLIYSESYETLLGNEDVRKEIRYKCYSALTTMGVKSGTVGEPFQVDLDLKGLLEKKLQELQEHSPVYTFLNDVIKSVDKDIQSQQERDNDLW